MTHRHSRRRQRPLRRNRRHGSVLVEMAITMPILFAFFGFLWEFSRAEMIRHTVSTAAYEGAREAIVEGASAAESRATAQRVLDGVGIRGANVVTDPTTFVPTTQTVEVTITVPLNGNALIAPFFLKDLQVIESITLNR